jgi:hypothetical protein
MFLPPCRRRGRAWWGRPAAKHSHRRINPPSSPEIHLDMHSFWVRTSSIIVTIQGWCIRSASRRRPVRPWSWTVGSTDRLVKLISRRKEMSSSTSGPVLRRPSSSQSLVCVVTCSATLVLYANVTLYTSTYIWINKYKVALVPLTLV